MGDITTRTVAELFVCADDPLCGEKAKAYINEEPQKIFDSYSCSVTPVMNGGYAGGAYLQELLVLCTGTPKKVDLKK